MIGIIDYGLGNLSSVLNAFSTINCRAEIFDNPKNIKKYANHNSRNPIGTQSDLQMFTNGSKAFIFQLPTSCI